jgi:hypothetical protein
MQLTPVPSSALSRLQHDRYFLEVSCDYGTDAECLEVDYTTTRVAVPGMAPTHDGRLVMAVPVYWLEAEREEKADLRWSAYPNSIKFKVTDGALAGYVGYLKLAIERPTDLEMH